MTLSIISPNNKNREAALLFMLVLFLQAGCRVPPHRVARTMPAVKTAPLSTTPALQDAFETATSTPGRTPSPSQIPEAGDWFDSERAFDDLKTQLTFGPRYVGSPGHAQLRAWLRATLEKAGWKVRIQTGTMYGHEIHNIIAYQDGQIQHPVLFGAHYDTRLEASEDPDPARRKEPVLGANDGASGVAVLLEMARILPPEIAQEVWLVFFDAEDNGNIPGWDWILGSRFFVQEMTVQPEAVVIVDMIADEDLAIYRERNSSRELMDEIWETAHQLGYQDAFRPSFKYTILDDHVPFREAGITAVNLIDFDYPYWHTTDDTLAHVSPDSLDAVGETIFAWLLSRE
jgi:hypothetical protein